MIKEKGLCGDTLPTPSSVLCYVGCWTRCVVIVSFFLGADKHHICFVLIYLGYSIVSKSWEKIHTEQSAVLGRLSGSQFYSDYVCVCN